MNLLLHVNYNTYNIYLNGWNNIVFTSHMS